MRMRKKKNLEARMQACAALLIDDPKSMRGIWCSRLPAARELHLELGCGKGRFTCEMAASLPDVLFVAIERVPDALILALERAQAQGLSNVLFIDGDAAHLAEYFAEAEVDRIYINFCDPWPGNRHSRRRLTHEEFLRSYRILLPEGGEIHFKTDNHDLFSSSLFQFPKAGYTVEEMTRNLHKDGIVGVMTDYEEKFHNLGMPINRCVGRKAPLPEPAVGAKEDETQEIAD